MAAVALLDAGTPPALPRPLPLPDTPVGPGGPGPVDVLAGSGSVTPSGAYSYSISLAVPAGRAGMQPTLSLEYSSSGGAGPLGVGWSVSGLSSIAPCPRTFAQDGETSAIRFDKSIDRYCLDGQRLVQVGSFGSSAGYGENDAEYRTETDTFARIVSVGSPETIDGGPDQFVVQTKDGRIMRYQAYTADQLSSAVTVSGDPITASAPVERKVVWLLDSVKDRSDNEIRYEYLRPVPNEATFLPSKIRYTFGPGKDAYRTVEFVYTDRAAEDRAVFYQSGVRSSLTKQLDMIKMWAPNPTASQVVWYYDLDYRLSASKRTVLDSVRRCGFLGTCTQAKKFGYGDQSGPTFTDRLVASNEGLNTETDDKPQVQVLDLNGDGATDVLYSRGQVVGQPSIAPHYVRLGARAETGAVPLATRYTDTNLWTSSLPVWVLRGADIDGDGSTELGVPVTYVGPPTSHTVQFVGWNDAQHVLTSKNISVPGGRYTELADMTGDGRIDVLPVEQLGQGGAFGFSVRQNTGTGFTTATQSQFFDYGCPIRFVDLDGDGRQELVGNPRVPLQDLPIEVDEEEGIESWPGKLRGAPRPTQPSLDVRCRNGSETYVLRLDGSGQLTVDPGFSTQNGVRAYRVPPMDMTDQATALGDFNGDGLLDALLAPRNGGWARVAFNTGNGLVSGPTLWVPNGGTSPDGVVQQPDLRVADFDSDGRADILVLSASGAALKLSAGDGTFRDLALSTNFQPGGVLIRDLGRPMTQLGDFNADGRVDLLRWNSLGEIRILEQTSDPSADRLVSVTDDGAALALESIDYATSWTEHPERYADYTCSYPLVCVRSGMVVVRQTKSYAHLSSPTQVAGAYLLQYSYEDPVMDLRGRGSLGFSVFRVWDRQRPAETITTFDNRFHIDEFYAKAGLPQTVQTVVPILSQIQVGQQPAAATARVTRVVNNFEVSRLNNGLTYAVFGPDSLTKEWEEPISIIWASVTGTPKTEHLSDVEANPASVLRTTSRDLTYSNSIDDFGNLVGSITSTAGGTTQSVTIGYDNRQGTPADPQLWLIGMPTTTTTVDTAVDGAAVARTTENHYDDRGLLDTAWVEKNNLDPSLQSTTTYQYDPDGVLRTTTVSSPALPTREQLPERQVHLEYGQPFGAAQPDERIYPSQIWSNHSPEQYRPSTWTAVHPAYGAPVATMDANGVATLTSYDDLGRVVRTEPDGAGVTTTSYQQRTVDGGINGVTTTVTGPTATTRTQTDRAGRTVEQAAKDFDGVFQAVTTGYDAFGRAVSTTSPAPGGTVNSSFDSLDRPLTVTDAANKVTAWGHTFFTTAVADPMGFTKQVVRDVNGRTTSAIDWLIDQGQPHAVTTSYQYAPFDQVKSITDDHIKVTTVNYDTLGRQTRVVEPDRGRTDTAYFGTGEPLSEIHYASRHGTTFGYDDLGRVTSTITEDGTSTFAWDTAAHGIGKPARDDSPDDIRTDYRYDESGRSAGVDYTDRSVTPAGVYSTDNHYDTGGRLSSQELPGPANLSRFTLQYDYNGAGHLAALRYAPVGSGTLLPVWDVLTRKPNGALDTATLGGGAGTIALADGYQPGTGRVTSQLATKGGATLYHRGYDYYNNGLVKSRDDTVSQPTRTEEFRYDSLSRLTGWDITLPPPNSNQEDRVITTSYGYDTIDNLTSVTHTDEGTSTTQTRSYGKPDGSQPHTLTAVSGPGAQALSYDSEGRQSTGSGRAVTYTAFDLPKTVVKGGQTTSYRYDARGQRVKETGPAGTTFYLPGVYEKRTSGSSTKHIYHLPGIEGASAQAIYDGTSTTVSYQLTDATGSVGATADATGTVTSRYYYDPYGVRINSDGTPFTGSTGDTHEGFTGHEHNDALGLINMNGRVNDPGLDTFLTADPLNTPGANPYSYVHNSPLNYTDPSGYRACADGMLKGKHQYTGEECSDVSGKGVSMSAAGQAAWLGAAHSTWMGCHSGWNCTFAKPAAASDAAPVGATAADVRKYVADTWGFLAIGADNVWATELDSDHCLGPCPSAGPGGELGWPDGNPNDRRRARAALEKANPGTYDKVEATVFTTGLVLYLAVLNGGKGITLFAGWCARNLVACNALPSLLGACNAPGAPGPAVVSGVFVNNQRMITDRFAQIAATESVGGNASEMSRAVNGVINLETGEIVSLGNYMSKEVDALVHAGQLGKFTIKETLNLNMKSFTQGPSNFSLVSTQVYRGGTFTEVAKSQLQAVVSWMQSAQPTL